MTQLKPQDYIANYKPIADHWEKINIFLTGDNNLILDKCLIKGQGEIQGYFNIRQHHSVFVDFFYLTLSTLVGQAFKNDVSVELNEQQQNNELINRIIERFDFSGNTLQNFARNLFQEALAKGIAYVLIDRPSQISTAEGFAQIPNPRSYVSLIRPENVIAMEVVNNGESEVTNYVRIKDQFSRINRETLKEEFTYVIKELYIQSGGVFYNEYQSVEKERDYVRVVDQRALGIPEIPLIPLRTGMRTGILSVRPPLLPLLDLNIKHCNALSIYSHMIRLLNIPLLILKTSRDDRKKFILTPETITNIDPNEDVSYLEHSGTTTAAGIEELRFYEEKMGDYGYTFLRRSSGNITATEVAVKTAQTQAPLEKMLDSLEKALNNTWRIIRMWESTEETEEWDITITVDKDLSDIETQHKIDTLLKMQAQGIISSRAVIEEAKKIEYLTQSFDAEVDRVQLENEGGVLPINLTNTTEREDEE